MPHCGCHRPREAPGMRYPWTWWLVSFIAALVAVSRAQYSKQFAGPYLIELKEVAKCGGGTSGIRQMYDSTRLSRFNRTTSVFSGNIFFTQDYDDNVQVEIIFSAWGNGGWKSNYHHLYLKKACTDAKTFFPANTRHLFRAMGIKDCPFPAGNFTLNNYPIHLKSSVPVLQYNKYRVEGFLKREGKRYACFKAYMDIVPKGKS